MDASDVLTFLPREFRGSRWRCLLLTHQHRNIVKKLLAEMAGPSVEIADSDQYLPQGFAAPHEPELSKVAFRATKAFLQEISSWWLKEPKNARTPNWDIVSDCSFGGRDGLLLVEAKAHANEINGSQDRCKSKSCNAPHIRDAIAKANEEWNKVCPGFALSCDHHYQLSTRFAFAWKLASAGIPVILVYLGFINATEMSKKGAFKNLADWETLLKAGTAHVVPPSVWNTDSFFGETPIRVAIRAVDIHFVAENAVR
jgi:hypothetical protein